MVETVEVARDRRQRGRDDGLVERGEEHAEHERREDHQDPAVLLLGELVLLGRVDDAR